MPALQRAREALAASNYSSVLQEARPIAEAGRSDADEAALLVARAHLRLNDADAALKWIQSRSTWSLDTRVTADILLGIAEHRTGSANGVPRLEQAYSNAIRTTDRAEAAYYRGWAAYRDRDLDVADRWLQASLDDAEDVLAARAHALLAYVEEAREDYTSSARYFRSALRAMRISQEQDIGLLAAVLHNLAVYGAELPDLTLTELVQREYRALDGKRVVDVMEDVVQTVIHIGIGLECAGKVDDALDAYDEAANLAYGSPALAACAAVATGDLLRLIGEPVAARRSLRRVADALRVNAGKEIEHQMPFLEAASVVARLEPSLANEWFARYSALSRAHDGRWALARDRRVDALEFHTCGLLEAAVGRPGRGLKNLSKALALWSQLGYTRRAAYAQADLLLLGADGDADALSRFSKFAPRHPLLTDRSGNAQVARPETRPRLTPAQGTLLSSLCAGKSVRKIALETGRSEFTLRNHLKRLFKAYGVKSSAALVAAAMGSMSPSFSGSAGGDTQSNYQAAASS